MRGSEWRGQVLHLFEGHALLEQVGDDGDAERVRLKPRGQGSVLQAALHHAADVVHSHGWRCPPVSRSCRALCGIAARPSAPAAGRPPRCTQRRVLAGNVGHAPSRLLFGGFDLALIMELIQEFRAAAEEGSSCPNRDANPPSARNCSKSSSHSPPTPFKSTKLSTNVASS